MASSTNPTRHRNDPDVVRRLLATPGRWAVVGLSANPRRVAYGIASYLQGLGMIIVPVHPKADTVHGEQGYPTLADVPGTPDVVDVFRKPSDLPEVLDETLAAGARTLWLQLGLWDEDVAGRAQDAGLEVVMDRCLKIEHARFAGGLHWAGFDTGVISSRRHRGLPTA